MKRWHRQLAFLGNSSERYTIEKQVVILIPVYIMVIHFDRKLLVFRQVDDHLILGRKLL
jgi:hypothetical protein